MPSSLKGAHQLHYSPKVQQLLLRSSLISMGSLQTFCPQIVHLCQAHGQEPVNAPRAAIGSPWLGGGIRLGCAVWAPSSCLSGRGAGRGMLRGLGLCCSWGAGRKWERYPFFQAFIPMALGLHLFLASLWDADVPGVEGGSWQER